MPGNVSNGDSVEVMRAAPLCCLVATIGCGDNVAINQPPEVASFDLRTSEDLPVVVTLDAADPEGAALTLEVRDAAGHGIVTLSGLQITYTPADDYNGPDLFSLRLSDGETETIVAVDVTVTPLNDVPFGGPDSVTTGEDTARVVTHDILIDNDGDVDGDSLVITAVSSSTNGTAVLGAADVTFTPAANFNGLGSFTYTLSDGTASVDVAVSVSIASANDAPVAVDDTASATQDQSIAITSLLANDTDADGNTLSISAVSNATNGSVTLNGNTATFTPSVNFVGTATFEYTVTDGIANDIGLVTITVTPP